MIAVAGLFSSPHIFYLPRHDRDDNALLRFIACVSRGLVHRACVAMLLMMLFPSMGICV